MDKIFQLFFSDQSSGSRGGRKGRGQKRVVDEEGDAQAQDKIVS